jgi:hypothetical protein
MPYTIIRDTREHDGEGWTWRKSQNCDGTISKALKTGDYTLLGYEEILAIERKGSLQEWSQNIIQVRFERELERLELIRFPFIILEFHMDDIINYPVGTNIPKYLWHKLKFDGSFILKKTIEYCMTRRVKILFCGNNGKSVASSIFKRTIEVIENGW